MKPYRIIRGKCSACGGRRRFKGVGGRCFDCYVLRKRAEQEARDSEIQVRKPDELKISPTNQNPFDRGGRRNSDESEGLAAYYRGAYFRTCEICGRSELVDGIVCGRCATKVRAGSPEAHFRDPDVSDVQRRLEEMRP